MDGPVPPGTRSDKAKTKSDESADSGDDVRSDVGGFSDMDVDSPDPVTPKVPAIRVLSDGRSVLLDPETNKQLVLPGKHEWKIGEKKGNYTLECITKGANIPSRYVSKALESSKVTELGATIPDISKTLTSAPTTPMSERRSKTGKTSEKDKERKGKTLASASAAKDAKDKPEKGADKNTETKLSKGEDKDNDTDTVDKDAKDKEDGKDKDDSDDADGEKPVSENMSIG
eukprot:s8_g42.t1